MLSLLDQLEAVEAMSTVQLRAEWQRVFGTPPPKISPDLLSRGIAYHLQERVHGGLAPHTRRQLERIVRQLKRGGGASCATEMNLRPGTRLSRDWHGRTHHVLVTDDGFLFEDRRYRSLTQIATAITGTRWSGPRFFGLIRQRQLTGNASA